MATDCGEHGTQFLLAAGSAVGGGAALGAVAGGVTWAAAEDARRVWHRLTRGRTPATSFAALERFVLIGGFLGGYIGLLVWLYERYALL